MRVVFAGSTDSEHIVFLDNGENGYHLLHYRDGEWREVRIKDGRSVLFYRDGGTVEIDTEEGKVTRESPLSFAIEFAPITFGKTIFRISNKESLPDGWKRESYSLTYQGW